MNEIKPTLDFEFKDNYKEALNDLLKAIESVNKLSANQRNMLAKDALIFNALEKSGVNINQYKKAILMLK